ncbi:MAG: hypothetical protein JXA28_07455 [Bacteroidetes bacterium]|nr:hypothetical protein [Bacteroidota bacterium]
MRCLLATTLLIAATQLLTCEKANAQSFASDSIPGTPGRGQLSVGFERNVNTFLWNLGGRYHLQEAGWRIDAEERFFRTLIRTDRNTIKDEQNFQLYLARSVRSGLAVTATFSSFLFSDSRALGLTDLSSNQALAGVEWNALPVITVTPMAGVSFDNQQGILDQGFMFRGKALLNDLVIGRAVAEAELYSSAEYIDPRFQAEYRGSANLVAEFGNKSLNQTQMLIRQIRREFYLPFDSSLQANTGIGHSIESREERVATLSNSLHYRIARSLNLLAVVDLTQRDIRRDRQRTDPNENNPFFATDISEFHLNGSAQLRYDDERGTRGMLRVELNERDEDHSISAFEGANPVNVTRQSLLEEQKNNVIRQSQIALHLSQALGAADTIALSASTVKMQYDTPSDENFDDRDELWVLTGFRWMHHFSPCFRAGFTGDVNLRHTVYIFSERSANNTWNRVLRLSPMTEFRLGPRFVTRNTAEVVANYTVYDFESGTLAQRSFSLRQLTLSDSTTLHLGGGFWMEFNLHLRFYERGELRWSAFTVRPIQYFDERSITCALLRISEPLRASVGFRLFEQRRFVYERGEKVRNGLLRSYGPTTSVRLRFSRASEIIADGWYQLTTENEGTIRVTPNISLHLVWNL